jgi:hypothetical protein
MCSLLLHFTITIVLLWTTENSGCTCAWVQINFSFYLKRSHSQRSEKLEESLAVFLTLSYMCSIFEEIFSKNMSLWVFHCLCKGTCNHFLNLRACFSQPIHSLLRPNASKQLWKFLTKWGFIHTQNHAKNQLHVYFLRPLSAFVYTDVWFFWSLHDAESFCLCFSLCVGVYHDQSHI